MNAPVLTPGLDDGRVGGVAVRVGTDLQATSEVQQSIVRFGPRYLRRLFTAAELTACGADREPMPTSALASLAARYAAKEAFIKVLRTKDVIPPWTDIEVVRAEDGWTELRLTRAAETMAAAAGLTELAVSLSHSGDYAMATVVATVRK